MSATKADVAPNYSYDRMIEDHGWLGEIVRAHSIGRYILVEYIERPSGDTLFAGVIDGKRTACSYETLEQGIVGCIARAAEGPNGRADRYFFRMLDAPID